MQIPEYETYHETKRHSGPDFPYNTYICSIPLDFCAVPLHWHEEVELIYIKKGCGRITLDFTSCIVSAGDIIIVGPGQLHAIDSETASMSAPMEYENIIFSIDMLCSRYADTLAEEFFEPFVSGYISFDHFISHDDPEHAALASCLDRADTICSSFPKGYKLAIKSCLFEFFYTIFTNSRDMPSQRSNNQLDKTKSVIKYIENHYAEPITIDEIADAAGFSPSHFMRFFKNIMGTSFITYLNDYRLTMASRMLTTTDSSILDIAIACGYDNLSYFNRCFKKKYSKTPSEFRRGK